MTETLESRYPPPADPPLPLAGIVRLADFEPPARERLHPAAWSYYAGGSWDEHTLRDTLASWSRYRLRPRVLVDVEVVDLRTTLLGSEVAMPFGIAPAALHGMAHADGECATARAAAAAGVVQVVSTVASRSIEEVAAAAPGGLALVPALRPARPRDQPRPGPASRGGRLRRHRAHRRPAGAWLPRRGRARGLRSRPRRVRQPAEAGRVGWRASTRCSTCAASGSPGTTSPTIRELVVAAARPQGNPDRRGCATRRRARGGRGLGLEPRRPAA